MADLGAGSSKVWTFGTAAGPFLGLASTYEERNGAGTALLHKDYTWAQDTAGNVYTGTVTTTLDPGMSYAAQSKTVQVLDIYGNVVTSQVYDYGNLSSPARTYGYQYLTVYPQYYIRNRVTVATVNGITLATNTYDGSALTDPGGLTVHDSSYNTGNFHRGNLTRSVTPGAIRNMAYNISGLAVSADDGQGHSMTIVPAAGNYPLPPAWM